MTEFGKSLRKIRIDNGERLFDMAKKLGVSSAFLSAVENGKKSVPIDWVRILSQKYALSEAAVIKLQHEADESLMSVKINLEGSSPERRSLAAGFARRFNDFSDDDFEEFRKLLKNTDDRSE